VESSTTRNDNTHPPGVQFSEVDSAPLVPRIDAVQDLTRSVDADGQVLVRPHETLNGSGIGFSRLLSSAGPHCSVMTSASMESKRRANVLSTLSESVEGNLPLI